MVVSAVVEGFLIDWCCFGLYRDDGLGITKASPRQTEKIKKDLCNIFGKHGVKITIEANKQIVNFLDVSLNLSDGTHMPFNKSNNIPLYINNKSNHPPRIISNIPRSILIDDCPRFRTIKNPLTKQHQSIRKPSTTADTTTF